MILFTRQNQRLPDLGILPQPRTWDFASVEHRESAPFLADDLALLTCPNGHTSRVVASVHAIAADGALTPSYICPIAGCNFHDFVRFGGWSSH